MPDPEVTITADDARLADRLRRLMPTATADRDALLFAAGQAAARPHLRRWIAPMLLLLLGSVGGWVAHARPWQNVPEAVAPGRIIQPEVIRVPPTVIEPAIPPAPAVRDEDEQLARDARHWFQTRDLVARFGLDALHDSPSALAPKRNRADLANWLNVEPGILAYPRMNHSPMYSPNENSPEE